MQSFQEGLEGNETSEHGEFVQDSEKENRLVFFFTYLSQTR